MERESNYVFQPSFLWLMTGTRTPEKISRPLSKLDKLGVERIQGEVQRIDAVQKTVTVNGETLTADYLIIALGAELAPETIPGPAEAGHNFYTLAGAESLRDTRLDDPVPMLLNNGSVKSSNDPVPFKK